MKIETVCTILLLICLVAIGCASNRERLGYVKGLSPTIDDQAIKESTEAENKVFEQILNRAGCTTSGEELICSPPAEEDEKWARVVEAGFGFIDGQCGHYIDSLFWYDRFRNTTGRQVALTGAFTAAILGIADASADAIAITAAAFGFGSASFDNLSGTVLYDLDPAGIKTLVDRSRSTYREAVMKNASAMTADESGGETEVGPIISRANNRPAAMSLIRGYLSLCLPATIETQVKEAVSATDFEAASPEAGSLVPRLDRVDRGEIQARKVAKLDAEAAVLEERVAALKTQLALERAPRAPLPSNVIFGAKSPQEEKISLDEGIAIQNALCVSADGVFGEATRKAIMLYQESPNVTPAGKKKDGVLRLPAQIAELAGMTSCDRAPLGERNIFERRFFGENPKNVEDMQAAIDEKLKALIDSPPDGLSVTNDDLIEQASGFSKKFDKKTRDAITILQKANGDPVGTISTDMVEGQVTPRFLDLL